MGTAPRTAQANGITQAYRVWGPRDAQPLVLLHARGTDGADWASIAPVPATGPAGPRRVYAPDLRGHGRSDWPGAYAYEIMRDDAHALLGVLGIDRADVVGHSLGGAVAYLLAQRSPGLVRRLVLEDVPAPFPLDPPRPPPNNPAGRLRTTGR
ncbi:alpha/beta fold hydrolase [Streptomyces massasporeus]|uniref:alpha/beta fold hydrolase n=1 Tax=Streptomyces massasporeus TaxID=67324 RepID=UPI0033E65623